MADPLANTVLSLDGPELAAAAASRSSDAGPRVIADRYEILGLLGAGGMGNVYRARDRELEEIVAVKVLRPEIAGNAAALERFRREVKLARRVTHPNVARVFDIGEAGGEKYLTMELIDGEPLGALLARAGRLDVARAIQIAAAVCAGLGAAHEAGVVHRDLKPDNVLLTKDGRVVVTDFGIARAAASADANITGALVGTPAYMAPEQVDGTAVDARADIYALGAMLYEVLTGEPPWHGDSVLSIAVARLLQPPPDPRAKRPDLPPDLAALVLRCMARAPAERFASAQDVAIRLGAVGLAALFPPPLPAEPPRSIDPLRVLPGHKEVAVLPFRNVGPADQAHIADGLTEELIDLLSMAKGLRVRSRGTVMRYRGGDRDPREIGHELKVTVVVEGSVRRDAGQVRVTVRLVSVSDGVQIWQKRFERPETELFAIGDAAARAISEALTAQLSAPQRPAPQDGEAIDLYLRARSTYRRFFADLAGESIRLFERALAQAPDDPRILAGYAMATGRFWNGSPEQLERARRAAEQAVARAPDLSDSHVALATVFYAESREAEAIPPLKHAIYMSHANAEAHDLAGRILCETMLQDEARKHLETALMLEPDFQLSRTLLIRLHMLRGDQSAAEAVMDASPSGSNARLPAMGRICMWTGDVERARHVLEHEMPKTGAAWSLNRAMLETLVTGTMAFDRLPIPSGATARFRAFLRQIEAECAMGAGDRERALSALATAVEAGIFDIAWINLCPLFAPLRDEPRFRAVRDRVAVRARRIEDAYRAKES